MSIVKMTKRRIEAVNDVQRIGGSIEAFVKQKDGNGIRVDVINESVATILANIVTNPDVDEDTINSFIWFITGLEEMTQKK